MYTQDNLYSSNEGPAVLAAPVVKPTKGAYMEPIVISNSHN